MPHYLKHEAPESHGAQCNGVEDRAKTTHKQLPEEAQWEAQGALPAEASGQWALYTLENEVIHTILNVFSLQDSN